MITLHHLNNSRSQRILWLLEELHLDYQIKYYQRDPKTMLAPASLKTVHPLGKSPVITDGESADNCITVAESGAIIEYLLDRYDLQRQFRPTADTTDFLRYRYFLHYAEGSLMPLLVMKLMFSRLGHAPMPWLLRPMGAVIGKAVQLGYLDQQIQIHADYLQQQLTQANWFAGQQFSASDIQMSFALESLQALCGLERWPELERIVKQMQLRPAYQRALEKGGEYDLHFKSV